jgi:hypothetical protein
MFKGSFCFFVRLYFKSNDDYNGRCETPVGIAGRLRPRRLAEEAQASPHGKGASWSCNQLTHSKIATMYTKTAFQKGLMQLIHFKLTCLGG